MRTVLHAFSQIPPRWFLFSFYCCRNRSSESPAHLLQVTLLGSKRTRILTQVYLSPQPCRLPHHSIMVRAGEDLTLDGLWARHRKAGSDSEHPLFWNPSPNLSWTAPTQLSDLFSVFPGLFKNIWFCFIENRKNKEIRQLGETKISKHLVSYTGHRWSESSICVWTWVGWSAGAKKHQIVNIYGLSVSTRS